MTKAIRRASFVCSLSLCVTGWRCQCLNSLGFDATSMRRVFRELFLLRPVLAGDSLALCGGKGPCCGSAMLGKSSGGVSAQRLSSGGGAGIT